ncbi:hypothetical protein SEA_WILLIAMBOONE_158 [Gordonia phage WilliamBoone]|nr:hypothetical protein SEA_WILLIAMBOONE_158 [Gordonia phage WilliamBoone]
MYVADMTLEEAREWRNETEAKLSKPGLATCCREQLSWDLQDLNDRIDELEGA